MLTDDLQKKITGEVVLDEETLAKYSHDASLFEIKPSSVIFPKNVDDVKSIIRFVSLNKKLSPGLSITARSAGTDMTGGPLNDSIILDFTKYLNQIKEFDESGRITVEPGVFYRDFEKKTLEKEYLLPSFPASKNICAMGGMINNNSGGEKTLIYGKTDKYISKLKVVLSDGNEYVLEELTKQKLDEKMKVGNFEGNIYRSLFKLLDDNYELIKLSRPKVSKNSVGYNIWDVWSRENHTFNMARLFAGSQGTLGITTEATFNLVKTKPYRGMMVIFLKDLEPLARMISTILPFKPVSLESFDDHTLRLSLKFLPGFLNLLGAKNMFSLFSKFLPDFWLVLTSGMPKIVILVEFESVSHDLIKKSIVALKEKLKGFNAKIRIAKSESEINKYLTIRRESFNLLRHKVIGLKTAPFIDDLIVEPKFLPQFLPELYKILDRYQLLYTIAGHVGDGNFHVIPLMNLSDYEERRKIPQVMKEVYNLVLRYGGSISAEHGDGMIRGPFIKDMFGDKIFKLFQDIKNIFDPLNIFNPHKKTDSNLDWSLSNIKQ